MNEPQLKSRCLTYYNLDKQKTSSRIFSAIEIEQANRVFDTVENILLENDINIGDKWVSLGKCGCGTHNDTYFMIYVKTEIISLIFYLKLEKQLRNIMLSWLI